MNTSRRNFLKLLGSLVVTTAADSVLGKETAPKPSKTIPMPGIGLSNFNILWSSYFPLLKENEGEKLSFYRCSSKKITVGYGSNVEENPSLLNGVQVYKDNKALSAKESKNLLTTLKTKGEAELAHYSVSKVDAQKMARTFTKKAVEDLNKYLSGAQTKYSFFTLPIPMQMLALDVFYNVGVNRFKKFKKFKTALLAGDFKTATKESTVYIGNKATNVKRERRKKRLGRITEIMRRNANCTLQTVKDLVLADYKKTTPTLVKIFSGSIDKVIEDATVCGEFNHIALQRSSVQNRGKVV